MAKTAHDRIISWYKAGLAAVDPARVTRDALDKIEIGPGKLIVLSIGKAAVPMASAAHDVLGNRINAGLMVTKQGQLSEEVDGFTGIEAAHPIPNEASLRAGETALDMVRNLTADDTALALISGGGSSLLECPIEGISLMDLRIATELLMYAGAGIYELNTVRKALSAIKGGGLRRAIGNARCVTLMLSDVIGNDYAAIASGPTVPQPANRGQAWQVIEDYQLDQQVSASIRQALTDEHPPVEHIDTSRDSLQVIADNETFVAAIAAAAESDGLRVGRRWEHWRGDARDLAHHMVTDARSADQSVDVLIGGGEATSVVRGDGLGGRNTETALTAALHMDSADDWVIASLASDGDDGNSRAAGGIVDSSTVDNALIAQAALAGSDSAGYLEKRGALVVTGQTGTNVNDVYLAVSSSALAGVLE